MNRLDLSFKISSGTYTGTYRLKRRWWGGWTLQKWDRIGEKVVGVGWYPLTDDQAIEFVLALQGAPLPARPERDTTTKA